MWHEARRSERKVHDLMDAARKRAQRRAVFLAKRRGDPQQSLQAVGTRCRMYRDDGLYQATEDQLGLIPWNGKQDVMIDRFDGRALLDFIRDPGSRPRHIQEKTNEEEELEEFVNFERYRDLIKHRRRGFTDEEGLQNTLQELEAKATALFTPERPQPAQVSASKGAYSQVGFSYKGDANEESHSLDSEVEDDDEDEDDDDDKDFSSDDSNDEGIDAIAKEFGIKRYNWLLYMDKKAKEEEKRQKEVIKGDPAIVSCHIFLEQRRSPTYDAYPRSRRSRSNSRSYSPSYAKRHDRDLHADNGYKSKSKAPKIEYITEFGGSKSSAGRILEALHVDPASGVSLDQETSKVMKPSPSTSSALTKLSKTGNGGLLKSQQIEKKETPQERLKRIMSKQLNKQIKKDAAADMVKRREQERQRQEKLAETSRVSRYRHRSRSTTRSRSPPRYHSRSRSPSPAR
ncbi:unnamed protein product [Spirodela intermedia]|uniref:Suppressor of white apricot N-terminal domain-containing protein n=1 Tax=Spirodela intermedia TaxID=51605 RepID=A0A7I8J5B0_SPIIN|nr:unnamed protein product [Spirodela intermedia]CAA6664955.1 unnamed protein product [Spirodela intermedia]